MKTWIDNEAAKEAATVATVAGKSAGSTSKARIGIEEAVRLGVDRNDLRLQGDASAKSPIRDGTPPTPLPDHHRPMNGSHRRKHN